MEPPPTPPTPPESPAPVRRQIFAAFREAPKKKPLPWLVGGLALTMMAILVATHHDSSAYTVVTPKGIMTVRREMTSAQVKQLLGRPIGEAGEPGCLRYGWPKLDKEFDVYRVCYAEGRVREVKTERFEVRKIVDPNAPDDESEDEEETANAATPPPPGVTPAPAQ